jgi:uncharacterized protein YbaR (Trm112 family)
MPLDLPADVLALLRCPQCHGGLAVEDASVRCDRCRLRYRSDDGLLDMLIEDAAPLDGPPAER